MLAAGGDDDERGAGYAGRTMRDVELPPLRITPPVSPAPGSSLNPAVTREWESAAREMHRWLELHGNRHGNERGAVGLPAGFGGANLMIFRDGIARAISRLFPRGLDTH